MGAFDFIMQIITSAIDGTKESRAEKRGELTPEQQARVDAANDKDDKDQRQRMNGWG